MGVAFMLHTTVWLLHKDFFSGALFGSLQNGLVRGLCNCNHKQITLGKRPEPPAAIKEICQDCFWSFYIRFLIKWKKKRSNCRWSDNHFCKSFNVYSKRHTIMRHGSYFHLRPLISDGEQGQMPSLCEELNESSGKGESIPCSILIYLESHSIAFKTEAAEPVLIRTKRGLWALSMVNPA